MDMHACISKCPPSPLACGKSTPRLPEVFSPSAAPPACLRSRADAACCAHPARTPHTPLTRACTHTTNNDSKRCLCARMALNTATLPLPHTHTAQLGAHCVQRWRCPQAAYTARACVHPAACRKSHAAMPCPRKSFAAREQAIVATTSHCHSCLRVGSAQPQGPVLMPSRRQPSPSGGGERLRPWTTCELCCERVLRLHVPLACVGTDRSLL